MRCMNTYEYGIHERFIGPLLKHVINVLGVIGRVIQTSERMAPFKLCTKSSVNRGSGPNWQEYLPWLDVICNFDVLILLLWPNLVALDSLDFAHLYESAKKFSVDGTGCSAPVSAVSEMDGLVVQFAALLVACTPITGITPTFTY